MYSRGEDYLQFPNFLNTIVRVGAYNNTLTRTPTNLRTTRKRIRRPTETCYFRVRAFPSTKQSQTETSRLLTELVGYIAACVLSWYGGRNVASKQRSAIIYNII
jgi:hypothetical protein